MTGTPLWELLGEEERQLLRLLRSMLDRIDPVPVEVLRAATSLGQRIADPWAAMRLVS
ncbi:hypothetical protein GCM10010174_87580 [Kutzneria viridogrisea]|uniref:Uncharacterized protein n=2 Tax=Kutzneria TaxID=43356 RepID=W5WLN7_9PSEU|nr:hypothetical protein [Kutzneria albida]AHI01768.1 hypothetical protein KALB_8411 [Kutzneria albida DSM 43870]MBA8931731.1 hypothetical protein [Kutzneria viridogrisea]